MGRPNLSRRTNLLGANGDNRDTFIFPVQLITGRIGNLMYCKYLVDTYSAVDYLL